MTYESRNTSPRDPQLENAKFLLMVLVVIGHLIEPLIYENGPLRVAYTFIYLFHMPAFAAVSGYLSRPALGAKQVRSLLLRTLWPYAVFQLIYRALDAQTLNAGAQQSWVARPYWILWFLISLLCWRLLLPLFSRHRLLPWLSVPLALAAGLTDAIGYDFSLSRTLVFFPLFLLGHHGLGALPRRGRPMVAGAWIILIAGLLFVAIALRELDVRWLYGSHAYAALGVSPSTGMAMRLGLGVAAALLGAAFLIVVPRRPTVFTAWGANTLYVYLLHGLLVLALRSLGADGRSWPSALQWLLIPLGVLGAFALAQPLVARLFRPIVEPVRGKVG